MAPQVDPQVLRQKYALVRPFIYSGEYAQYISYGYNPADLIVGLYYVNPGAQVDACPGVQEFYVDEPYTSAGWGMQDIIDVADAVHAKSKIFGVGEQGELLMIPSSALTYFNSNVVPHLDFVTYTNYQNIRASNSECDQRGTWSTLRQNYGAKFDRVWIASVSDGAECSSLGDEYSNLLGHASNLGISIALFYCGLSGRCGGLGTQRQLDSFCSAARNNG